MDARLKVFLLVISFMCVCDKRLPRNRKGSYGIASCNDFYLQKIFAKRQHNFLQ